MNLNGASAIVTGGASGIGEASAPPARCLGAKVVIADLQEDRGTEVAKEIGGLFAEARRVQEDGLAAVAAASEMGPLRALVNSAGLGRRPRHRPWQQRADAAGVVPTS
ncbi:MAG: SDR family NAD(P)-dependent oxidoreductase [Acidimicrobiales bacterium]